MVAQYQNSGRPAPEEMLIPRRVKVQLILRTTVRAGGLGGVCQKGRFLIHRRLPEPMHETVPVDQFVHKIAL